MSLCQATRIQGILTGINNPILGQMANGADYGDTLHHALANGYAEAEPICDVYSLDAAGKVVILANHVMGHPAWSRRRRYE